MEHYFTNNANLKSDFRTIEYHYGGTLLKFTSDLGVFSKDKIDYGSRLLVETYIERGRNGVSLLDVGCGYGFMGITLAKFKNTETTMIDVNRRALHLTNMNAKENGVSCLTFESDVYSNVSNKYDVIVTNPPIRAGKAIVHKILIEAKEHLNNGGELWFVMRKDQGAKSAIKKLEETMNVEIINRDKGFYIIVAKSY